MQSVQPAQCLADLQNVHQMIATSLVCLIFKPSQHSHQVGCPWHQLHQALPVQHWVVMTCMYGQFAF